MLSSRMGWAACLVGGAAVRQLVAILNPCAHARAAVLIAHRGGMGQGGRGSKPLHPAELQAVLEGGLL